MKKAVIVLFATLCSFVTINVVAQPQPPSPEDQAKYAVEIRQSVKKLIAWNNQAVGDMMRKRRDFDAAVVKQNAERVAQLAAMLPDVFAQDTSSFGNLETKALAGIWKGKADFDGKAKALQDAANALAAAAATGDESKTMMAAREIGKACGSCHDNYRAE